MRSALKRIDLSDRNRVFIVGDIHGNFSLLEQRLTQVGFDKDKDALVSVGDLIDRGPESHMAIQYIKKPWFFYVMGNHQQLPFEGQALHMMNGGSWLYEKEPQEIGHIKSIFKDAPIILEVTLKGFKFGVVHAAYLSDDWNQAEYIARSHKYECLWDREQIRSFVNNKAENINDPTVKNIDAVFHGHTPLKEPFSIGNRHWIDTGAFATGVLTLVQVNA